MNCSTRRASGVHPAGHRGEPSLATVRKDDEENQLSGRKALAFASGYSRNRMAGSSDAARRDGRTTAHDAAPSRRISALPNDTGSNELSP